MKHYIWEQDTWPNFTWDTQNILPLLNKARQTQATFLRRVKDLGLFSNLELQAQILVEETFKTSAIEGEKLNIDSVRSSVALQLGLPYGGVAKSERHIEGLVASLLDATRYSTKPLTVQRMQGWQASLFPTGYSGLTKIRVGKWRGDSPMQIISGPIGKEKVHYEAPPSTRISAEIQIFLDWFRKSLDTEHGLIRAAIAHLWFVSIHPFEDGNGRISRIITEQALAQDEKIKTRFYSLSSQIMQERNRYYLILEQTQKNKGDITEWLEWFLSCFESALTNAEVSLEQIIQKSIFWNQHREVPLSDRQRKVINRLLDHTFEGRLTTRKYVGMTKASRATAYREITDLEEKGILKQNPGAGRSVSFSLRNDALPT